MKELKTIQYDKCPFCDDNEFEVERVSDDNLYFIRCKNKNVSAGGYYEVAYYAYWRPVSVKK